MGLSEPVLAAFGPAVEMVESLIADILGLGATLPSSSDFILQGDSQL